MALAAYLIAGIVVFGLAVIMVLALCAAAALVAGIDEDELPAAGTQPRTSAGWERLPAIDQVGELADVVEFDFPRERPRLVLIAGGRDAGEGAA